MRDQVSPAHEVAAKLTACEFKQVIDIVRRWPNNFASGTLAALETQKHAAQRELTTSTSTDVASGRPDRPGFLKCWAVSSLVLHCGRSARSSAGPADDPSSAATIIIHDSASMH